MSTITQNKHARYDKESVRSAADCVDVLKSFGYTISSGRTAALWRGGTNPASVSVEKDKWYDHSAEEGGDVFKLLGKLDPSLEPFPFAIRWLGERYSVKPSGYYPAAPSNGPSRYKELTEDEGYIEVKRYDYTDENGELVQQVVRLEHESKGKQFLQCDASGRWGIKHIQPVLYNLPAISKSDWVIVVEGEKDADTLIAWGLPATTNAGGSKKWEDSFSDALSSKDVILMPDNDPAGQAHLHVVGSSLKGKARTIRTLTVSQLPKGDITDWFTTEGGTKSKLIDAIKTAPEWVSLDSVQLELTEAKEANAEPFKNFKSETHQDGPRKKTIKVPHKISYLVKQAHRRFLGFPRRIGQNMFDHDRETGEIVYINSASSLFSWMGLKSDNRIVWARGDDFTTKDEFLAGLHAQARVYESISKVPDWPRRDDVYYAHPDLPDPDPDHKYFNGLIDFLNPATPEDEILARAMTCAPIFYLLGIPRPLWIIDSRDGAGTGKTTMAELISYLYDSAPIAVEAQSLRYGFEEIIKRMVSSTGRLARVFLIDNVTGNFRSDELSSLITRANITGKAPYGRGEESRPNNLTYIITANSASIDNDLAVRSFFIFVKRANLDARWKQSVMDYISRFRLYIFADIIDILSSHKPFDTSPKTRFPEFETQILQPHCRDKAEYERVIKSLESVRDDANSEHDQAQHLQEILLDEFGKMEIESPLERQIFIHTEVLNGWIRRAIPDLRGDPGQIIRNLSKNGMMPIIDPQVRRYPRTERRSGIMWKPDTISASELIIGGTPNKPQKRMI